MPLEPNFSHIYVESEVAEYPFARQILKRFPMATSIEIRDYKEVFSRPGQDFDQQKRSLKLILARKKDRFLYDGSRFVQDADNPNFFYNALSLNCIFDCAYCYLQGMYNSANLVCFVNLEDYFEATDAAIQTRADPGRPLYLCISYDTDLLAFEHVAPYCRTWIEYCQGRTGDLTIEIRTKSANFAALADLPPQDGVTLAWSLSPAEVCQRYELGAPPLKSRLKAMALAVEAGWSVRLCVDPILPTEGWRDQYMELVEMVFQEIKPGDLLDAHIGVFRMNADFFSNVRKRRPPVDLFYRPWKRQAGMVTHAADEHESLTAFVKGLLTKRMPPGKIRSW